MQASFGEHLQLAPKSSMNHPALATLFSQPKGFAVAESYLPTIQSDYATDPHVPLLKTVMDADVLQKIDLCPTTSSKTFDSIIDNSAECIQQLSPISFWDSLDTPIDFGVAKSPTPSFTHGQSQQTSAVSAGTKTLTSPIRTFKVLKSGKTGFKRPHTPERKRSRSSNGPSALDSSDYWLRFDSDDDDDSLDRVGEYDGQEASTKRRPLGLIQPASRNTFVGSPGSFKLAFQGAFDGPIDDSALDRALSDEDDALSLALDEEFLKKTTQPETIPPERLYSTPLSWEPPQPGMGMDNYFAITPPLNDPERQRLIAIAMGTGMAQGPTRSQTSQSMDFDFDIHQSPTTFSDSKSNESEPRKKNTQTKSRSGQITPTEPTEKLKDKSKTSERAAHNDIERKYRTNLKDRIAELREAIPSLRSIPEDGEDDGDSPVMQSRAPKVSKGTVLTKATEYIHQLERRNRSMAQKNQELTRRLQAFEQLLGAGPAAASPPNWQPQGYGASVFNPNARGFHS